MNFGLLGEQLKTAPSDMTRRSWFRFYQRRVRESKITPMLSRRGSILGQPGVFRGKISATLDGKVTSFFALRASRSIDPRRPKPPEADVAVVLLKQRVELRSPILVMLRALRGFRSLAFGLRRDSSGIDPKLELHRRADDREPVVRRRCRVSVRRRLAMPILEAFDTVRAAGIVVDSDRSRVPAASTENQQVPPQQRSLCIRHRNRSPGRSDRCDRRRPPDDSTAQIEVELGSGRRYDNQKLGTVDSPI